MHHAQSLWDIRQYPSLYQVFTEFFGNPRFILDINRCIFRPPVHRGFPDRSHGTTHWDADPRVPGPASLQAVILLTDVGLYKGGFQCLPGGYQNLDAWLQQYAMRGDFDFASGDKIPKGRPQRRCGPLNFGVSGVDMPAQL